MEFRITIPDDKADRVVDALAARWGYDQVEWEEGVTPTAKPAWVRDRIKDYLRDEVRAHELAAAQQEARLGITDPF